MQVQLIKRMREKSALEKERSSVKNSPIRIHTQAKEGMSRKREATESSSSSSSTEAESSPTKRVSRSSTTNTTLAPLSISCGRNTPFQEPLFSSPKGRSSTSNTTSSKDNARKFQVSYKPEGFWMAKERKCAKELTSTTAVTNLTEKKCFYISTSYVPLGLSIDIGNSFTKEIEIGCHNVSKIRVLYKGEENNKDGTGPKMTVKDMVSNLTHPSSPCSAFHSLLSPIYLSVSLLSSQDIDQYDDHEGSIDENDHNSNNHGSSSSGLALMQRIVLNTPYPCQAVEVLILNRTREFVSIFYVQSFAYNIRSSSQSTPVTKPNHTEKNKKISQLTR